MYIDITGRSHRFLNEKIFGAANFMALPVKVSLRFAAGLAGHLANTPISLETL